MNKCKQCGNEIINPTKSTPKGFCSCGCYEQWTKFNKTPNCSCAYCGISFYMKPSRIAKAKHGITCSKECANKLKSQYMMGELNHQYGLTGDKNTSFKGKEILSNYGYILEYCPNHPFPHDKSIKGSRVFQHRLVIEANADRFDSKFFIVINGKKYLKPEYVVHHKNENRTDNRIENLDILTISEHSTHHNKEHELLRNNLGRIIGVVKKGELLETPKTEDNQQPSIGSNTNEGSTTSNQVLTGNAEDSNITTSALPEMDDIV